MKTLQEIHEQIVKSTTADLIASVKEAPLNATHPVSIYFLMNFTINPIEPFLKHYLYQSNFNSDIIFGQYDNIMQEILDDQSILRTKQFDLVVCSLFYHTQDALLIESLNNPEHFINQLSTYFDNILEKTSSLLLLNTLITPFFSETGITSQVRPNQTDAILEINQFIRHYVRQHANRCFLMDWNRYTQLLGEQNSLDYRYWYMYKAPFKKDFLSLYSNDITKVARALKGKAKKCLILDCDNTLWGGIIGEDGIGGIKLDNHNYPGKVFYDFQQTVLKLSEIGVILALCSKNNEQDVWEVFEKHPYSLLRRNHFAAHRINWVNKADNIIDLVNELNIGIDSCVFVDDSKTECELIRTALPDVTVLQVPQPIYEYPALLLKAGLFDTISLNQEDASRNKKYQEENQRKQLLKKSHSVTDYLASLELVALIHPITETEIPRVTQLTQKTNQFNLNTQRYTQQQIENFYHSENSMVFSLTAKDKFGDYGLTGVLIAKKIGKKGLIDTFLMSCRVLSRNLEDVFVQTCLNYCKQKWGVTEWEADFVPSDKNMQIVPFLQKTGFTTEDNQKYFLNMNQWSQEKVTHIKVITEGITYA